jgi:hypothetical protein
MAGQREITIEQLIDWAEGRFSESEAAQIAAQLAAADAETQAQAAWLQAFMKVSAYIVLASPPAGVRQALDARFAEATAAQRPPSIFQRFVGALQFDSSFQPAFDGVRGTEDTTRELLFSTPQLDVALNVQARPQDDRLDLLGQLLTNDASIDPSQLLVEISRHESSKVKAAMADEFGEFSFSGLKVGHYQMVISGAQLEIVIPLVELTA